MTTPNTDDRAGQIQRIAAQLAEQGYESPGQTEDQWVFLIDPEWQPETPEVAPPVSVIVGRWLASADGTVSRFEPNPDYAPLSPDSPTDPVDATIQQVTRGESTSERLYSVVKASVFAVALDECETPIVAPSPDKVPSLLVTTAPLHRRRVKAGSWRTLNAAELAGLAKELQVDLLFNPGARASIRLIGDMFVRSVAE